VTKTASEFEIPTSGAFVTFTFLVENIGVEDVTLTSLTDTVFGDLNGQGTCVTGGLILIGGSYTCSITVWLTSDDLTPHYNVVTAVGTDDDGTTDTATDDATIMFLYWAYTPGFWKNHTIDPRNAWLLTEFSTDTVLSSVFTFNEYLSSLHPKGMSSDTFGDITLLEALSLKGGSGVSGALEILMRAAAAAVLNTSFHETLDVEEHPAGVAVYNTDLEREVLMSCDPVDPDCVDPVIYYPFTTASLIEKVNLVLAVYTKNGVGDPALMLDLAAMLDGYNNGIEYMDWSWLEPYMPFP